MRIFNNPHVLIGLVWDEVAKTALPPGISATNEMTGDINIYRVTRGRVVGAYQAADLWLHAIAA